MRLSDLLRQAMFDVTVPEVELDIVAVTDRASQVVPGALFVAVEGVAADGHDYIDEAVRNGAVAVVGSKERPEPAKNVLYLRVRRTRRTSEAHDPRAVRQGIRSDHRVHAGQPGAVLRRGTDHISRRAPRVADCIHPPCS